MVHQPHRAPASFTIAMSLIVGQVLPWQATRAAPSEVPSHWRFALQPLHSASETAPPAIASDSRSASDAIVRLPSVRSPAVQQEVTNRLVEYLAEQQSASGGVTWVSDASSTWISDESNLPNEEELPADGENSHSAPQDTKPEDGEPQTSGQQRSQRNGQRARQRTRLDPELVRRGQGYFESSCTMCHDAQRATNKRKSLAGWLATVRRMAAQEDADIPADQHLAIATYLASLNPAYQTAEEGEEEAAEAPAEDETQAVAEEAEADVPPFTLNGTLSPVWRGTDPEVENKGFFPDVWVGIEWRPANSPVSGKVMVCSSCHGVNTGLGVELVEAAATLDLCHLVTGKAPADRPHCRTTAELSAGRILVPFGAFSGRVHPGVLRTVSLPLMYNMGRRVGPLGPGQPVINLPYSDEGANLHLEYDLTHDCDVTLDTYVVNGLQVGGPSVFFFSRSYQDNNSSPAVGGRATVGTKKWRFGGSVTGGELQNEGEPLQTYTMAGGDVSFRHEDIFRAYYEYAIRKEDSFAFFESESIAYGNLVEAEVLLLKKPKISFLARYDTLEHRGFLEHRSTDRFTYGLNWVLPGGSLLIVDHEHWMYDDRPSKNILGLRWTAAF